MTEFQVSEINQPARFSEKNFPCGCIFYDTGELFLLTNWRSVRGKNSARCISLRDCSNVDTMEDTPGIKLVRKITAELVD